VSDMLTVPYFRYSPDTNKASETTVELQFAAILTQMPDNPAAVISWLDAFQRCDHTIYRLEFGGLRIGASYDS